MRPANTSIVTLLSEVGRSFVGFFVTLYLARVLGAEILGTFFVVMSIVVWLKVPLNAVGTAMTKRVSEGEGGSAFLGAGGLLYLGLTVVMSAVILIFGDLVDGYVGAPVAPLMAALLLGNGFFSYVTYGLDGQKHVARSSILKAASNIAEGGAQIAFVLLGYRLTGLIAGPIVALVGGGLVGLALFEVRPGFPGRDQVESLMEYARYSWLGTVKGRTFGWMDTLVLSAFVGSGLIGIYEISWRIASVLILLSNAIQRTIFPEISDHAASGDEDRVRFFVDESLFYAGLTAVPGLFGALVLGEKVLRIYGTEFTAGTTVLALLIVARLVNAYGSMLLTAINGLDRPDVAFRINGVFLGANLVLNVGLIYRFGWIGAAVATTVSATVAAGLGLYAIRRLVGGVDVPVVGLAKQVLAGLGMAGVTVLGRSYVPIVSMYYTIGYVFFGAAIYGVLIFAISERVRRKTTSLLPTSIK